MARGFTVFTLFVSLFVAFERWAAIGDAGSSPEQTYRALDGGGGPPPTPPPCLAERCN